MTDIARGRRDLMRAAAAWVGGGAALAAARSAVAWQVEEIAPESPLGTALANRCAGSSDHAALVAQLQAQLAKEPARRQFAYLHVPDLRLPGHRKPLAGRRAAGG